MTTQKAVSLIVQYIEKAEPFVVLPLDEYEDLAMRADVVQTLPNALSSLKGTLVKFTTPTVPLDEGWEALQ